MTVVEVVPVTAERWEDMCELFERRGPGGGFRNVPRAGREPGLLAYEDDGEPVGWVSVGPHEDFDVLLRSPQYRARESGGGDAVWSLVCFTVDRAAQRRGVARKLLSAAVEHAFAHGASSLEAYPHRTEPTNYMGHVELFEAAGFVPVRETSKRVVMRLARAQ